MSATDEGDSFASAIGLGADASDGIARSLRLPRALIDAHLRIGSALLGFAAFSEDRLDDAARKLGRALATLRR